jgi:Fe-S-cluster-containing hydrogenase component 2
VGAISGEIKKPFVIDSKKCIKCGVCMETCKFGAVEKK